MNTINVAIHVHYSVKEAVEEPSALQEAFEKSFFHEASYLGFHPQADAKGSKKGEYVLPVKMPAEDQHEAIQKAKAWALEIAERDAPDGLAIQKVETSHIEHDW